MYKLLIVDDEETVVNSIAYDISWSEIGISEVFKAHDAQNALEIMDRNRVDVVISDIRMPEMDGIELARLTRKKWPFAKIIFVSGFDDFVYAQQAIEMGIFSYIVKPVRHERVQEVVRQAIGEIEKELLLEDLVENAERQRQEAIPVLQERYLNSWIVQERLGYEEAVDKLKLCSLPMGREDKAFLLLVNTDRKVASSAYKDELYESALRGIIKDVLLRGADTVSFTDPEDHEIIMVGGNSTEEVSNTFSYMQGMAESFQLAVQKTLGYIVSLFWSDIVDLPVLSSVYRILLDKARRNSIISEGNIIGPGKNEAALKKESVQALHAYPSLQTLVESRQKELVLQRIDEIFTEVRSKLTIENILNIYHAFSTIILEDSLKRGIKLEKWDCGERKFFFDLNRAKNVNELYQWCRDISSKYLDHLSHTEKSSNHYLVETVKKMIMEKIQEDVSLEDIASRVYIHPNHLSRLFRDKEGITITEYRIRCRVEKAKELLKVPGIKVYEVAEQVGFGSVSSLNRIFKNVTGKSPKEFQCNL